MVNDNVTHKYSIELDVLATAGESAIRKLGEKGNVIYVDFDQLEERAKNNKDPDRYAFGEVLNYINQCEFNSEDKFAQLPTGGIITWKKPDNETKHITRSSAIKSKLKREGKIVDFPRFLVYGHEVLTQGLVNVNYNEPIENMTYNDLIKSGIPDDIFLNNQFYKINGREDNVLQLRHKLIANHDRTRYKIDEDSEPTLELINPNNFISKVPGYKPRNLEQKLAFINAIDTNIEVHVITGGSGSGKTVTAYAAAINHILGNEKKRKNGGIKEKIVLFKSNDIIGGKNREEGFLPGSSQEKNWPFMKSYKDAHDLIGLGIHRSFESMLLQPAEIEVNDNNQGKDKKSTSSKKTIKFNNKLGEYFLPARSAAIEVEQLIYARGRTFENCVLFFDEAQNYTPYEMKQAIERAGKGSVIFIVGDPEQLDNPMLSKDYNGLTYAANIFFTDHPRFSMIHLDKNYRLQAAEIMRTRDAPRD